MKPVPIEIKTFAGLELDKQPLLAANKDDGRYTASTATNVVIDRLTREVRKSKGSSAWLSAVVATGEKPLKIIEYVYPSEKVVYIVRTSGGFYLLNDTRSGGTKLTGLSALPATVVPGNEAYQIPTYAQIGKHLVIVDGSGSYYWDGNATSSFQSTRLMEPPKTWALDGAVGGQRPKLALDSGGTFTANKLYTVWMTFWSTGTGHSPPLPCGSILTDSSNKKIKVYTGYGNTGAASATAGTGLLGGLKGYAPPPNGSTFIYFWVQGHTATDKLFYQNAVTFEIGTGTAVGDEMIATLTAPTTATPMSNFNGAPGGCTIVCSHVGRAWYSGSRGWPNRIWFSEEGQPFIFKPTSWIDVGSFDDEVRGLASFPYGSQLLGILKRSSVWSLAGWTEDGFLGGLQPVSDQCGCISPNGITRVEDTVYFTGPNGIFAWPMGQRPSLISSSIQARYLAAIKGAS